MLAESDSHNTLEMSWVCICNKGTYADLSPPESMLDAVVLLRIVLYENIIYCTAFESIKTLKKTFFPFISLSGRKDGDILS